MERNVKLKDLCSDPEDMDPQRVLEERLREAACIGDTDAVQELVNLGVDVNTRHSVNGWTPLHWACKRGYLDVAALLLKNGADKTIRSEIGETPAALCSNQQILQLLGTTSDQKTLTEQTSAAAVHNFVPRYIKHDLTSITTNASHTGVRTSNFEETRDNFHNELVIKVRIANAPDPDFVEVEIPRNELTYQNLIRICCEELDLCPNQIQKLRKLPNTKLRKDKDIQRFRNFEEIEVVTDSVAAYKYIQNSNGVPNSVPVAPANGYQSMSKKDQVILY